MFLHTDVVETVSLLLVITGGKNPQTRPRMLMRGKVSMHVECVIMMSKK